MRLTQKRQVSLSATGRESMQRPVFNDKKENRERTRLVSSYSVVDRLTCRSHKEREEERKSERERERTHI